MPISLEAKRVVKAIIGVFETGKSGGGDAAAVTRLKDHAGITFGLHQATDAAGSLDAILIEYADRGGLYAKDLLVYQDRLERNETVTSGEPWVEQLEQLLAKAGREDPVMRAAEESVFDRLYWAPIEREATSAGLQLPLSYACLYDTAIQSGPTATTTIRRMFPQVPPARGGDERAWALAYMDARELWLSRFIGKDDNHTQIVRNSVYRPRALRALARNDRWELRPPLNVQLGRGVVTLS